MATVVEKIEVENVNVPGSTSRVDKRKYLAMREVLLKVSPSMEPGLTQSEMVDAVKPELPEDLWPGGAKSGWWVKTVQLDLEAKGLVVRETGAKPLRWHQAST